VISVRDLTIGTKFKLYGRYKDGTRRPRLRFGSEGVRLQRAYLRLNNHALGPCVLEISRAPFDFTHELTVVEHLKGGVTMVRDEGHRLAPLWSGIKLQQRTENGPRNGARR
jgi:hypothetical protein